MTNNFHRYENDLTRFLLVGVVIGFIALLLTIVAYTIGVHQGQSASLATPPAPTTTAKTTTTAAQGKVLFVENGCGGCHTFAPAGATGTIGPNLATAIQAAKTDHNTPLSTYLRQSITDPNAYISPGYHAGVMPTSYATKLNRTDLATLVAFIAAGQKP